MSVRCKVRCTNVTQREAGNGEILHEAEFTYANPDSPENKEFFKWTPGISVKLAVLKNQHFVPGKEYYLEFTESNMTHPLPIGQAKP